MGVAPKLCGGTAQLALLQNGVVCRLVDSLGNHFRISWISEKWLLSPVCDPYTRPTSGSLNGRMRFSNQAVVVGYTWAETKTKMSALAAAHPTFNACPNVNRDGGRLMTMSAKASDNSTEPSI